MNQHASITPRTNEADLGEDIFEAARHLFLAQIAELRALASTLSTAPISRDDANILSRLVHNIAGTASYFGNAPLGRHAVAIEHQLHIADYDEARQGACLALLDALDRMVED